MEQEYSIAMQIILKPFLARGVDVYGGVLIRRDKEWVSSLKCPLKILHASAVKACYLSPLHWLFPILVPYRLYNEKLLLGLQQDLTKQGNIDKCQSVKSASLGSWKDKTSD